MWMGLGTQGPVKWNETQSDFDAHLCLHSNSTSRVLHATSMDLGEGLAM